MDENFLTIVTVAATVAFVLGIVSGFWPVLLISAGIALLFLWLTKRLHL